MSGSPILQAPQVELFQNQHNIGSCSCSTGRKRKFVPGIYIVCNAGSRIVTEARYQMRQERRYIVERAKPPLGSIRAIAVACLTQARVTLVCPTSTEKREARNVAGPAHVPRRGWGVRSGGLGGVRQRRYHGRERVGVPRSARPGGVRAAGIRCLG